MKKTIIFSALILAGCQTTYEKSHTDFDRFDDTSTISAEPAFKVESYACYSIYDFDKEGNEIILSAFVDGPSIGIVTFSDYHNMAIYVSKGIDRRWYYDCDDNMDSCDSMINMRPNGYAHFYDFSNADTATGEFPMKCEYDESFAQEIREYILEDNYFETSKSKPLVNHEIPAF